MASHVDSNKAQAEHQEEKRTVDDVETVDYKMAQGKVKEVNAASVVLAAAVAAQKPSLLSKNMLKLYFIMSVGYLVSTMNGFDSSLMGAINAMAPYQESFGLSGAGKLYPWMTVHLRDHQPVYRLINRDCVYHLQPWPNRCLPILRTLGRRLRTKDLYLRGVSDRADWNGRARLLPHPERFHGRPIYSRFRGRDSFGRWTSLYCRAGPASLPGHNGWSVQYLLVAWQHPCRLDHLWLQSQPA